MPVDLRTRKLAQLAVKFCVEAKKGDKVIITGSAESLPFLQELYKAVILNGSIPIVRILLPDVDDFFYKHANKEQLEEFPQYWMDTIKGAQCYIRAETTSNTRELTSADAKKVAKRRELLNPISSYVCNTREKIKRVTIAYPCPAMAQEASMSLSEWEDFVYSACLQDWSKIKHYAVKLKNIFKEGSKVEIIGENVNLKMRVHGKKAFSDLDKVENMPAGEFFMAPFRESMEGEITFDYPRIVSGKRVAGVYFKFSKGKIIEFDAEEGKEFLGEMLKTDENSSFIGELGIGFNPRITRYSNNLLFDEKIDGTIHLAIGAAYRENGGGNDSAIHEDFVKSMRKAKIIVDGKIIQENGKWKI